MSSLSLQGVYIEQYGSIKQQYLELDSGLNVLYGLNGAGKSQILDCLVKAITNDPIFSIVNETFDYQESTMAGLLFKANSGGATRSQRTWRWGPQHDTLPNSDDVLEALLGLDNVAKLSESPQSLIEVDTNYSNESEELIRETVSSGLLVLVPVPGRDGYQIDRFQIIYSINRSSDSKSFQKHFRELREAMTHAYLECESYGGDSLVYVRDEIWSKHLKNVERSPLYNVFTLQGSLADRTFSHYGYGWGKSLDKEGLLQWPMPFVPVASLGFVNYAPINLINESKKTETIEQLSRWQTFKMANDTSYLELLGDSEKENLKKEFLKNYSEKLSIEVNELAQTFLLGLPAATFELKDSEQWMLSNPPSWQFSINNREVEFDSLANVQRRFCTLAMRIKFTTDNLYENDGDDFYQYAQRLLIVDEPESGLNRESEDHMALGFASLQSQNITCIVASHSPSFSNLGSAKVNLVKILGSDSKITSYDAL
jgi:energy-coupling factor transporter ATP-binding protein EcfA2